MSDFQEYGLLELCDLLDTQRRPVSRMNRDKMKGSYPYYGASGIVDYINDYIFSEDTILISEDGENLNTRNTPIAFRAKGKYWVNNHAHVLRPKKDHFFPLIINYIDQMDLSPFITGAVQPKLSQENLSKLKIFLPVVETEQLAIAGVLSSLDDKIDLSQRQNKTLEGMAEALWRKMFVENADPGWKKGKLGDLITSIESGRRPKGGINPDLQYGIPSIGAENIIGIGNYKHNKTKYIPEEFYFEMNSGKVQDFDVLIYKDGAYIGRKSMFACGFPFKQCCVNEHVFILRTKNINTQIFLYFLLEQEELEQLNANSAQPGLNQEAMKSFEIFIPNDKYIEIFGSETKIIIDKIFFNSIQIRTLCRLREALLPKLMAGEVRVKI